MPRKPSSLIPFNILMEEGRHRKLTALAADMGISKSAVCRQLIDNLYQMRIGKSPTCANGQTCFVAHMHPPAQTVPAPQPQPTEGTQKNGG